MNRYNVELANMVGGWLSETIEADSMDAAVAAALEKINPDDRWKWREKSVSRLDPQT